MMRLHNDRDPEHVIDVIASVSYVMRQIVCGIALTVVLLSAATFVVDGNEVVVEGRTPVIERDVANREESPLCVELAS